jgi:hypothetical protein
MDSWYPAVEKGGSETMTSTVQRIKKQFDIEFTKYIDGILGN